MAMGRTTLCLGSWGRDVMGGERVIHSVRIDLSDDQRKMGRSRVASSLDHKVLDNCVYAPIGHCIYCGARDDLEKEHVLPFGLSGSAILPKSSCRNCAAITGAVEEDMLRGAFWPARIYRNLKSRTKHKNAPRKFPVSVVRGGQPEEVLVEVGDLPIVLPFPLFPLPGHLSQAQTQTGILVSGIASVRFGTQLKTTAKALGASKVSVTAEIRPAQFARMIAKIGYAYACAEGAVSDLDGDPFVLPAILGHQDEIGRWVGTLTKPIQTFPGVLHRIAVHHDWENRLLFAEVQLFSDSETPSYGVVLGKLDSAKRS